ncbi:Swi3-domain-containing protein [Microthyrium microscopicum]|uniref:Chromosome segregation in meiosis protein n=1 Tax=Microthyrium microscopicum TaxID=703497 RepID=A0A6A6UKF2_9PEZI|nr:Swi3-domain-containing protein [Microthyrium microscopicum]
MAQDTDTHISGVEHDDLDELWNNEDMTFDQLAEAVGNSNDNTGEQIRRDGRSPRLPEDLVNIDEQVEIKKKKRAPIPKLDEIRLTSAAGIPTLQRISKSRIKFRGKGHEFSDVALLLGTYQLWLHELYPRAKFHDGLAIIEKLGHKKNVQRLRSDWINESKSSANLGSDSNLSNAPSPDPGSRSSIVPPDPNTNLSIPTDKSQAPSHGRAGSNGGEFSDAIPGAPDEDELEALLAGEPDSFESAPARNSSTLPTRTQAPSQSVAPGEFADEEDIMREMGMFDDFD